jgi:hypothetical protein
LIRVALTFHPAQKNPARASGFGVYRVKRCYMVHYPVFEGDVHVFLNEGTTIMYLTADRVYKERSRVDPLKIALAVRKQRGL